jgi:hypothetical protein
MAFLDIARTGGAYETALFFRGELDSTATVAWGTRAAKTSTGLVEHRIISASPIRRGVAETFGGAPPRVDCTIVLNNADNGISYLLRGNTTTNASTDYLGDGLRNLTGQFFLAVRTASGSWTEAAVTPTMCTSGRIETDGFNVTVPMSSQDEVLLGPSRLGAVTVQQIKDSVAGSNLTGAYVQRDGTVVAFTQSEFTRQFRAWTDNLDKRVPFVYGKTEIQLIRVSDTDSDVYGRFVLFVSSVEPNIEGFDDWELYDKYGVDMGSGDGRYRTHNSDIATKQRLFKVERDVTLEDGTTASLWVVFFNTQKVSGGTSFGTRESWLSTPHHMIPSYSYLGIAYAPPPLSTHYAGPLAIIHAMSRDHAEAGSAAIDATSFFRSGGELQSLQGACGGLYYGDKKLADAYGELGRAFGFQLWVENDDTIHAFVAWGQADKDAIDAGTPYHIQQAEILDGWKEWIPDETGERGSSVNRVYVSWDKRQEDFYPPKLLLRERAFGATQLPTAETHTDETPGAWIFPPKADRALTAHTAGRAFIARRIEFVGRAWLATEAIGTIYLVSHVRGLADNAGTGYVVRPMRLESTEFTWNEDGCRVVLADLQGDYTTKPSTLDTIDHWIATQTANGDTFSVTNGSPTLVAGAGNSRKFSAADVGRHVWLFGAANESNRRSRRISAYTDATHVTMEFNASATETITCDANTGWDSKVLIVDTQESKGSSYKPDKIRLCAEATGLFRDGVTAGFQVV